MFLNSNFNLRSITNKSPIMDKLIFNEDYKRQAIEKNENAA